MTRSGAIVSDKPVDWQPTYVFVMFLILQVLDGLLTFWGVSLLGVGVEANTLVAGAIETLGLHRALLSTKLFAVLCGYILYRTAFHRPLAITTGLTLGVAVVPWLLVAGTILIGRF